MSKFSREDAEALVEGWLQHWTREGRMNGPLDRLAKANLIERMVAGDNAPSQTDMSKHSDAPQAFSNERNPMLRAADRASGVPGHLGDAYETERLNATREPAPEPQREPVRGDSRDVTNSEPVDDKAAKRPPEGNEKIPAKDTAQGAPKDPEPKRSGHGKK